MTADTVGGVWTYALDLIGGLAEQRVDVALATMGGLLSRRQREQLRSLPNAELFESAFRLEWMDDPWPDVDRAADWLLEIEQRTQPDAIHLNGYAHAALPWNAPVVVVAHSCVLSWWQAVLHTEAPPRYDRYRREAARGLQSADLVIAPSRDMMDALVRHYGVPGSSAVIPNGRDAALFRPSPKEPFVLAAGRVWDQAKNIAALDEAAAGLPWPVLVAGDACHPGGDQRPLRHARALGCLPPAELARYYSRAAIYALPARYEPFGLSVLEAALAGCALVLGDIDSLQENWSHAALFADPEDTGQLRAVLAYLAGSQLLRQALGERARDRARRFTVEKMAAAYAAAYDAVLAQRELNACA